MNYGEIKRWLDIGVGRSDLSNEYGTVINRAARIICDGRTWTWMQKTATVTCPNGSTVIDLPADFKELNGLSSSVSINYAGNTYQVIVHAKKELQRLTGTNNVLNASGRFSSNAVRGECYLDWANNKPTLNFITPALGDITMSVDYFAYPAPLVEDTDENPLTQHYPELLIHKAKAFLFEAINDDGGAELANAKYLEYYNQYAAQDSRKRLAGITLRM